MKYTDELCPHCDEEVKLKAIFDVQECPRCNFPILPCSICTHGYTACNTCPLDLKLKEKQIEEIMSTIYPDDDPKYDGSNVSYLKTLSTFQLGELLDNHKKLW